ncbi:MAG: hypothetical protein ABIO85_10685 [Sphingomicrobium sp.]
MPKKIHVYFVAFTSIFVALVLTGFSRRYFIPIANGTFSRPAVVHIHGLLFLTWTLLLLLQASLAATGRLRVHRKIGSIGAWLIIPMLSLGTLVAARDTVHDFNNGDGQAALSFFYGELADLAQFGLLAGAAMLLRYKPDFHKRLVIIGSLGLLGAAIGRIPEISAYTSFILDGLIASVAVYDLASHRRVHAATVVGTAVLLAVGLTEEAVGNTRAWLDAAHHLLAV